VRFLAISDRDGARARALAEQAGADLHSGSNDEVINHPDVTAVIVSTPEQEHTQPILTALQRGLPVLVEKPIGFSLRDADRILDTLRATKGDLRVGYSRRYKECFLRAKEQMLHGRLGKVRGRHRPRLQFARAGLCHSQARPACHAGARRAHLLRRSDVLVSGGQPAGRGGGARPARHLQGGRLRRPRRDLGDRDLRGWRRDQSRRQLCIAGALPDARPVRTASSCSAAKAP